VLYRVWLLALVAAGMLTAAWMFATIRIRITSLFAAGIWSFVYVASDTLEVINPATGDLQAVDIGAFEYLILSFALLSFVTFIAAVKGWYPPDVRELSDDELRGQPTTNRQ
jgi:hypothetical protein